MKFSGNDELVFHNSGFDLAVDNGKGSGTPQAIDPTLFGSFPSAGSSADRFAYDPGTGKVNWIMGTGQNRTHMIYVFPDAKRILTTNVNSATVTILDKTEGPAGMPPGPSALRAWSWRLRCGWSCSARSTRSGPTRGYSFFNRMTDRPAAREAVLTNSGRRLRQPARLNGG